MTGHLSEYAHHPHWTKQSMEVTNNWFTHSHAQHDVYLMIVCEPGQDRPAFSYVGRVNCKGHHPCYALRFSSPPFGHDYLSAVAALEAGLAHSHAIIERWTSQSLC